MNASEEASAKRATSPVDGGAEVAARVADECAAYLEAPIRRLAAPDTPVPFSPVMENFYVPSVEGIVAAAEKLMEASR